jgi:5-methyltetrahydrofolate--homocysteine methyltransferase
MISGTITDRAHALGPDGRRRSGTRSATRGRSRRAQLRARRGSSCGPTSRSWRASPTPVSAYPNAGLPNEFGGYDETPEDMAAPIWRVRRAGSSTSSAAAAARRPEHIRAIAEAVRGLRAPRARAEPRPCACRASSRSNDRPRDELRQQHRRAHQRHRLRAVPPADPRGDYEAALEVARQQVENGAQIIDVNMDEGMLDGEAAMTRFLNLIAASPTSRACR